MATTISVIILNYNGISHLEECLGSLAKQLFRDFETILVDNGSVDGSAAFVRERFPEVKLIELNENTGFCKGNNIGISHAKGEFVAFLNNDTSVDEQWLAALHKALSADAKAGFCASKVLFYDNRELVDTVGDAISTCGAPFKRGHMRRGDMFDQSEYIFGASGSAAIYRRSMLEDAGALDEDFFAIFEDGDLSFRCQLMGYKCIFEPNAIVYHKVNSTLKSFSDFYVYYGHRNVEYLYIKNMPAALIARYFHIHLLYGIMAFIYFLSKGKALIFLKAKFDVLKNMPVLLGKRAVVQKRRTVSIQSIKDLMDKDWFSGRRKR